MEKDISLFASKLEHAIFAVMQSNPERMWTANDLSEALGEHSPKVTSIRTALATGAHESRDNTPFVRVERGQYQVNPSFRSNAPVDADRADPTPSVDDAAADHHPTCFEVDEVHSSERGTVIKDRRSLKRFGTVAAMDDVLDSDDEVMVLTGDPITLSLDGSGIGVSNQARLWTDRLQVKRALTGDDRAELVYRKVFGVIITGVVGFALINDAGNPTLRFATRAGDAELWVEAINETVEAKQGGAGG